MTKPRALILGTRGSQLALRQSMMVREALLAQHPELELELRVIKTKGDRLQQLALDASGDKGLFTKELEHALRTGEIDLAVHSLKDLPVVPAEGTCIGAILPRAVTVDCLIGTPSLEALPAGALIGTSSRRRAYQLAVHYPQLRTAAIRGNIDTRLAKLESGQYDAILLAEAGLSRLGLEVVRQPIPAELIVPAPGQAAIAVHVRQSDEQLLELLRSIHDTVTAEEVGLERRLLQALGGGCALPLGCVCHIRGEEAELRVFFASEDGQQHYSDRRVLPRSEAEGYVLELAEQLKKDFAL